MITHHRNIAIALCALGLVVGVGLGVLVGILLVAPSAADIRNACVADTVVPRAGLPPGLTPGPLPTPQVVTPLVRS